MNNPSHLIAIVLAAAFGFATVSSGVALAAEQPARDGNDMVADAGQAVSDTWITTKVKAELATTEGVKSTDISVETNNGVVTLTGVLADEIAAKKAVAAAKSVKGVRDVDDSGLKVK